jgi:hypothetical protein
MGESTAPTNLPSRPGWDFGSCQSRATFVYQTVSVPYKPDAALSVKIAGIRKKFSRKDFSWCRRPR